MSTLFKEQGFYILNDILDEEVFIKMKNLHSFYLNRVLLRHNHSGNVVHKLFRTENILSDFLIPEIINNQKVYSFLYDCFGNSRFHLKEITLFSSHPQNDIQELHSDEINYFPNENIILPTTSIAVQFPLVDFNYQNGGTRIIPKTHLTKKPPISIEQENENFIKENTPKVNAKGCLVRDIRAWHGAGKNNSDLPRSMYVFLYTRSWLPSSTTVSKDLYFSIDKEKRHLLKI